MAGEFKHQDLNNGVTPDDPGAFLTPTKWDKALRLSGGTNRQLVQRDTSEANTGMSLTSRPLIETLEFTGTAPSSPANMNWWIEDDGLGGATLRYKTSIGTILSIEMG